jgi:ribokinase
MGGLAVALAEGKPLEAATLFANITAALSTRRPGAMPSMPARPEVDAFLQLLLEIHTGIREKPPEVIR